MKVLLIDDNNLQLIMMSEIFTQEGVDSKCILFTDNIVKEAIDYVPDVIVLDLYMPEKTGIDLVKELKNNSITKNIPVIFMSSSDRTDDKYFCFKMGCMDYIEKPFDRGLFISKIKTFSNLGKLIKLSKNISED